LTRQKLTLRTIHNGEKCITPTFTRLPRIIRNPFAVVES
jgi:hypothetical protein